MDATNATPWTIADLGSRVALALAVDYTGQANGRVREVPDQRTIRYYTTLGLIDRPQMRGRTALYGRRHLLQLVAIKRLQAKGLTLAELQQRLLGLPDLELEAVAQLPSEPDAPAAACPAPQEPARDAFWTQTPAPTTTSAKPQATEIVQGVRLLNDVTLLLNASRALDAEEIEALRVAAAPLLKLLEKRRLLRNPAEERNQP